MIQVLTYWGTEEAYKGKNCVVRKIHDAESLDAFDINVIILNDRHIWENNDANHNTVNCIRDLSSIATMIDKSKKSKNLIILPQNLYFCYGLDYSNPWKIELKNMLTDLTKILNSIYLEIRETRLYYENTQTNVLGNNIRASFCFDIDDNNEYIFTKSTGSNKPTTIGWGDVILSTLDISNYDELYALLKELKLIEDKMECPEWMNEITMFDDEKQQEIIQESLNIIQEQNDVIEQANDVLAKNTRYKSILYTNGDALVEVVFDILQEMLECDLSQFEDIKKEDFCFEIQGTTFIGEIKGVNHNVKNENISQLDVHYQSYFDEHEDVSPNDVKALLIMNHQKNKPITNREEVHEQQIKLAERNGSLIIETPVLLKLFEEYLLENKTREECISLLRESQGLLKL